MEKERIVILGAGFGGIAAARTLGAAFKRSKTLREKTQIVVIDQRDEHTYTPGLYETATTLRRDAEPLELKRASTMQVTDILAGLPIRFVQDRVDKIDLTGHALRLRDTGTLVYTVLLVAAGSKTTDFGIPGVLEHAVFLKTFTDALHLRRVLTERLIDKRNPKILIVGGGASGVEVAGEIIGFARHLCSRDGRLCDPAVTVLESGDALIRGLSPAVGIKAKQRLKQLGADVVFGARVTEVRQDDVVVTFKDGKTATLPYKLLIWTAGIEPESVCGSADIATDKRGRWLVDEELRVQGRESVYAVGDITVINNPKTAAATPATAYVAIGQGKLAARNILADLTDTTRRRYRPPARTPMVIPIGGKWAIAHYKPLVFTGFIAFLLRLGIDLRYFLTILPLRKALRFFATSTRMYFRND